MCKMKSVQVPTPGIDDTSKLIGRDWLSTLVLPAFGHKYSVARQQGLIYRTYSRRIGACCDRYHY